MVIQESCVENDADIWCWSAPAVSPQSDPFGEHSCQWLSDQWNRISQILYRGTLSYFLADCVHYRLPYMEFCELYTQKPGINHIPFLSIDPSHSFVSFTLETLTPHHYPPSKSYISSMWYPCSPDSIP